MNAPLFDTSTVILIKAGKAAIRAGHTLDDFLDGYLRHSAEPELDARRVKGARFELGVFERCANNLK